VLTPLRQWIVRTFPRITWQARLKKTRFHYLRTFADSKAIIAKAASAKRVVVVGASFIGLEVAASLRARGILVDVVAPDRVRCNLRLFSVSYD
jgi:NADPH-dependent 2,4-dienoyl-CoA reductase/sulfur reductase-like enzyme